MAEVAKLAEPMMRLAVAEYVASHKEERSIRRHNNSWTSKNLTLLTVAAMRVVMLSDIQELANAIVVRMKQPY